MGLSFVNAGLAVQPNTNMGLYIKYVKSDKFEVISEDCRHCHLRCPDREIYISINGMREYANPMAMGFDEYVDLNAFSEKYRQDFVDKYMINFVDCQTPETRIERKFGNGSEIYCDSGGFQIAMGRTTVINPIELVKFYNKNVDLGMVLDIPDYNDGNPFPDEFIEDLAIIQKRNTDYMLKYKEGNCELINIIHGSTPKQKLDYLEKVHDDRIDRLAIPSVGIAMTVPRLDLIIELCKKAKELGHYKHLHVLGTFNKGVILTLAKLANSKIKEVEGIDFTTDASSALQNSVNLTYEKNISIWRGLDEFSILDKERFIKIDHCKSLYKGGLGKFNEYAELPCNCPVCQKIKYSYVLRNIRGGYMRNLVFLNHNMKECSNYVYMVDKFAKNLGWKEYLNFVKSLQDSDSTDTVTCIKYLECVEKKGLEAARESFKRYLTPSAHIPFGSFNKVEEHHPLSDFILDIIKQYKEIDFENYNEKIKVGRGVRSATTMKEGITV